MSALPNQAAKRAEMLRGPVAAMLAAERSRDLTEATYAIVAARDMVEVLIEARTFLECGRVDSARRCIERAMKAAETAIEHTRKVAP